jgi:hypothetical protein
MVKIKDSTVVTYMGYIYLLRMADGVYKVGRTSQETGPRIKRMLGYPGDCRIAIIRWTDDNENCERKIISEFKNSFGGHIRGREYFLGNEQNMINIINRNIDVPCVNVVAPKPVTAVSKNDSLSLECPKCGKVFSHASHPSKARQGLDAHLSRKNACDSLEYRIDKISVDKTPIPNIEDIDPTFIILSDISTKTVVYKSFEMAYKHDPFACIPNLNNGRVWFYTEDELTVSTLTEFVNKWFEKVFLRVILPHIEPSREDVGDFIINYQEIRSVLLRSTRAERAQLRLRMSIPHEN